MMANNGTAAITIAAASFPLRFAMRATQLIMGARSHARTGRRRSQIRSTAGYPYPAGTSAPAQHLAMERRGDRTDQLDEGTGAAATPVPQGAVGPAAHADAGEAMRGHPLFSGLEPHALEALVRSSRQVAVATGEVLVAEGSPGDAAYLVLGGRFAVTAGGRLVGRPSRGDLIGEMALLVDEPRSATVTALRTSVVVRIDGPAFSQALATQPALHRRVSAQLVERIRRANTGPATESHGRVVAAVTDGSAATARMVEELVAGFTRTGRTVAARAVDVTGVGSAEVTLLELDHDIVLLVPGPEDPTAIASACDHADRVLAIVDGAGAPRTARELRLPARTPPLELMLVHPAAVDCPRGTHRWLAQLRPATHHHVRAGDPAHLDRVVRRMVGAEVALVLGGGGARGLAHVGTHRALVDAGVPIDVVAGTSAGSIFAVAIARGWSPDQVAHEARRLLIESGSPVDPTLPTVALASGRRINERIQSAFGDDDLRLEDLWVPTMIVSTNLTTADVHEHHSGPAWRAVRASVAIPGVFPPLSEPEGLLVDGGLVDTLPVARLRAHHPTATVIASDVGRRVEFPPDGFPPDGVVSGWHAWRLRRRFRAERRIPGVVRLLARLTALGGAGIAVERGDVHIDHELPTVSMFDFAKGGVAIEAGHRRAVEVLASVDASVLPLGDVFQ
jgi:NTE family protein